MYYSCTRLIFITGVVYCGSSWKNLDHGDELVRGTRGSHLRDTRVPVTDTLPLSKLTVVPPASDARHLHLFNLPCCLHDNGRWVTVYFIPFLCSTVNMIDYFFLPNKED